jgi:N-acetylmuramoyl-L-alanine amidase
MKVIIINKRWLITVFCLFIILTIVFWGLYKNQKKYQPVLFPGTTKVIVIDPGHGGVDPGAVGKKGVKEKNVNLAIALHLREFLEQSGTVVIMTRTEDKGLYSEGGSIRQKKNEDLKNRKEIVKNSYAHIFITIHLNSFPQSQYYGAQTFYPKDNPQGQVLAEKIQEEMVRVLDANNKRIALPKEDIYIIKGLDKPTVLIECGFLSNPREEKLLNNSNYQKKIAWAIYSGVQKYFADNP